MKNVALYTSVFILFLMHAVGLFGIKVGNSAYYLNLTSLNLLITFVLFFFGGLRFDKNYLFVAISLAFICFFIEVAGVKTQAIFGHYKYTNVLQPLSFDVPIIIGLNWAVLLLSCADLAYKVHSNIFLKALVGATLMLFFDIILEPVAIYYNFWKWETNKVPVMNFFAWWLISFILLLCIYKVVKKVENPMAYWVYVVQMLFFGLLIFL